jgi:hypothetical protein
LPKFKLVGDTVTDWLAASEGRRSRQASVAVRQINEVYTIILGEQALAPKLSY